MTMTMAFVPVVLVLVAFRRAAAFEMPALPPLSAASIAGRHLATSAPLCRRRRHSRHRGRFILFSAAGTDLEDVKAMRVPAIKQELESYGISTKAFLEKGELVDALVRAREEGRTPFAASTPQSSSSSTSGSRSAASQSSAPQNADVAATGVNKKERFQAEMDKCKSMKVSELRSELESYGIPTKSFFEKSEFVRAVAEARADGVTKRSKKKKRREAPSNDSEVEEVKAKVEVITSDSVGPKTKKTRDAGAGAGSGGNPFGGQGGGSPFGGAGGMGGMDIGSIADMLKGGGSPFGGGAGQGGNPFGGPGMADAMKAAQQAMSNPKVSLLVQKAQNNPKVMAAVQECMGNPMAMGKYMNDPEVGPILKELQDAMK